MSAASEWSKEAVKALIQAYKEQPLLYDTKMTRKSMTQLTWSNLMKNRTIFLVLYSLVLQQTSPPDSYQ